MRTLVTNSVATYIPSQSLNTSVRSVLAAEGPDEVTHDSISSHRCDPDPVIRISTPSDAREHETLRHFHTSNDGARNYSSIY